MKFSNVVVLLTLLSVVFSTSISAQIINETPFEKADRILKGSPIIFEGVVVSQEFHESTPFNCWTESKVQITRIFKGFEHLHCDEVILINPGSAGTEVDFGAGAYIGEAGSHSIEYYMDAKGIFFCKLNNGTYPEHGANTTPNPFLRSSFVQQDNFLGYEYDPRLVGTVSLSTINYYADMFAGMTFGTMDEVATFLAHEYQIDTNDFVKCETRPGTDSDGRPKRPILINPRDYDQQVTPQSIEDSDLEDTGNDNTHSKRNETSPQKHQIDVEKEIPKSGIKKKILDYEYAYNEKLATSLVQNVSRAGEELTFTLENEKFTGSNPRYFEFDVRVESNQSGTFLDNAPIHLSYSTNAFGANIVANNKIDVTLGSSFNDPTYEDPNNLSNDWASDTVVVLLGIDYLASMNRTQVPTSPTTKLHVKIEIANCYQSTDMFFVNQTIAPNVTTFTTTATEPWTGSISLYDDVHYNGDLDLVLCQPVITNFTNPIHAGINDILVIDGKHFGSSQGSGQVWLKDCDSGGSLYIKTQDPIDYVSWSDTKIELRVPSRVVGTLVNGYQPCAGSGDFLVKTNLGDSVYSSTSLDVQYAIMNTEILAMTNNDKIRYNLINDNGDGSYTFQCDTSISNYPLRKAIVERAIHDWNCRTEVNWKVGNDTTLGFYGADGVNLIFFDTTIHGNPAAQTRRLVNQACGTSTGGTEAFYKEVDIRISIDFSAISNSLYWWYDTTGASVPADAIDFYGTMLHELGHAHAIKHVNDPIDPMYYSTSPGPIPSSNRNYNPSKWYNLVDAGVDVVTTSESITYNCSTSKLISAVETDCSIIDQVKEIFDQTGIDVYPNPTSDISFVKVKAKDFKGMQLFTITGSALHQFDYSAESQQAASDIYSINLSSVPSGIYILQLNYTEGAESVRVVKN